MHHHHELCDVNACRQAPERDNDQTIDQEPALRAAPTVLGENCDYESGLCPSSSENLRPPSEFCFDLKGHLSTARQHEGGTRASATMATAPSRKFGRSESLPPQFPQTMPLGHVQHLAMMLKDKIPMYAPESSHGTANKPDSELEPFSFLSPREPMPSLADLIRLQIPHLKPIGRNPKSLRRAQSDVPPTTKSVHEIAQQMQDQIPTRHDQAPCLTQSHVLKTSWLEDARLVDCDASDATLATGGTTSDEDTVSSVVVVQLPIKGGAPSANTAQDSTSPDSKTACTGALNDQVDEVGPSNECVTNTKRPYHEEAQCALESVVSIQHVVNQLNGIVHNCARKTCRVATNCACCDKVQELLSALCTAQASFISSRAVSTRVLDPWPGGPRRHPTENARVLDTFLTAPKRKDRQAPMLCLFQGGNLTDCEAAKTGSHNRSSN
jgi:hypothetical protein